MYLFKPYKNQEECDKDLEYLLSKFPRDTDRIRIITFLGRFQVTNEHLSKLREEKNINN